MKVLLATEKPFAAAAVQGIRKAIEEGGHTLAILEKYTDRAQLLEAVKDADALIVRSDIVDGALMDVAPQLKIVVRAGAGYDNIDLKAATAHNIVVENTPRTKFQCRGRIGLRACCNGSAQYVRRHVGYRA